ncbi:MAG: hypothetical protein AAF517_03560 [Planctomycetota bacterium]
MAATKRTSLIAALSVLGLAIAAAVTYDWYQANRYLRVANAPRILTDAKAQTLWQIESTGRGSLLRPTQGKFRGWHLSVDLNPQPVQLPGEQPWRRVSKSLEIKNSGPMARSRGGLILTERPIESSYWKVEETNGLLRFLQAQGPFERWVLDGVRNQDLTEDKGWVSHWDLGLAEPGAFGVSWKVSDSDKGQIVRLHAIPGAFYLDADPKAEIETRDLEKEPEPVPDDEPIDVNFRTSQDRILDYNGGFEASRET